MTPLIVSSGDVARCPTHRLDVGHYRRGMDGVHADGCYCVAPSDPDTEPHLVRGTE